MSLVSFTAGGQTYSAPVEGYEAMSPEDQATVNQQIVNLAHGQQDDLPPAAPAASPQAQPDTSYTGALGAGIHNAAEGLGKTAELVGNATGWQGATNVGKALEGATAAPTNYQPTTLGSDLKSGDYSKFFHELPRAATEGAADMAGYLTAGAAAGPVGVAAYAGARNLGDNVAARAANNDDATPTAGDWAGGALTTAGQAGLAAIGLGKAGIGRTILEGAAPLAKPAVAAGLDAAGAAGSDVVGQLGTSVGTNKGAEYDPYETAAAGAQGAVARLASTAPELARVGIKTGSDAVMSNLSAAPASTEDAASIVRVNQDYQTALQQAQATRGDVSPLAVMNSVKSEYINRAKEAVDGLRSGGLIDPQQAKSLTSVFVDQAQRHNNTIAEGSNGYSTLFDRINELPLPDEATTALTNAARDLNTLSTQSFANKSTGPFEQLGRVAATTGAIAGSLAHGNALAAVGIMAGHGFVAPVGAAIGAGLDRVLGTNTPTVLLRANKAAAMLRATNQQQLAGTSSLTGLQNLTGALSDLPPTVKPGKPVQLNNAGQPMGPEPPPPFTVQPPVPQPTDAEAVALRQAAWQKAQGRPQAAPDPADAWQAAEAQRTKAQATVEQYLAGLNVPGQNVDPMAQQMNLEPAADTPVPAEGDLAAQQAAAQARLVSLARTKQVLRNQIADRAADVDVQAQKKLDNKAKVNAITLAAAGKVPNVQPKVDDIAVDAAVNQAMGSAASVMNAAGRDPDTGLPAADPVPVNEPVAPPGQTIPKARRGPPKPKPPLAEGELPPPKKPRAPRAAQPAPEPVQSPPETVEATPAAPTAVSEPPGPPPARNLAAPAEGGTGVEKYIAQRYPGMTIGDVHSAIDAVHTGDTAAWLKAQAGADRAYMQPVIEHLALQRKGSAPKASAATDEPGTKVIRNPLAYQGSIDNYRSLVRAQIEKAHAEGHPEAAAGLQAVLMAHGDTPEGNALEKTVAKTAALQLIKNAKHRAAASKYFTKPIMSHGPKESPKKGT